MDKLDRVVIPLRILLAFTFAVLVLFQVFSMPGQFAHMAKESPEDAYLRWPLTIFAILELLCVQIVIVCTWRLLTMIRDDRIFSERAFVWVDVIVWTIAVGWLMLFGLAGYLISISDDPGTPMALMVIVVIGAVLGLLMVVMRALLHQATTLRSDMDAVI